MRLHQIDDFVALVLHNVVASPGTAVDFLEALVLRWPSSASPEGVAGVTSCLGLRMLSSGLHDVRGRRIAYSVAIGWWGLICVGVVICVNVSIL